MHLIAQQDYTLCMSSQSSLSLIINFNALQYSVLLFLELWLTEEKKKQDNKNQSKAFNNPLQHCKQQ